MSHADPERGRGDEHEVIGLDRGRAVAELFGDCLDPVDPASERRDAVAVAARARAVASPMPDDAPVMTATRPVF